MDRSGENAVRLVDQPPIYDRLTLVLVIFLLLWKLIKEGSMNAYDIRFGYLSAPYRSQYLPCAIIT